MPNTSNNNSKFSGKTIIVTGASSGIGRQTALDLGAAGASVVAAARSADKLKTLVAEITKAGGRAIAVTADVTKDADNKRVFDEAKTAFGAVHGVFLNAGVYSQQKLVDATADDFRTLFDTNVLSVTLGLKYAPKTMTAGKVVVTSSVVSDQFRPAFAEAGLYIASKAAVDSIIQSAQAQAGKSIHINSVSPGIVDTPMTGGMPKELVAKMQLAGRGGRPREVSSAVQYLLSDEASFVYGANLRVDGGWAVTA